MKKNAGLTELVFVLDRSGSMMGLESDTIGGFNAVLEKHKKMKGKAVLSTVLFDHEPFILHDRINLAKANPLTARDYEVRGCTALLDAVGGAIRHTARVQDYLPKRHKADHVVFVIVTDGMENASCRYQYHEVKAMIRHQQKAYGWEFMFLGANIDAAGEAAKIGIASDHATTYLADEQGTKVLYQALASATCCLRDTGVLDQGWDTVIQHDRVTR